MTQDPNKQTPPNESVDEQNTIVDPRTPYSTTDQLHHNLETDAENVSTDAPVQNTPVKKPSKYKILLCTRQISQNPYPIRILLS